ncbi:MAG: sirohydrochlorin chelatase [Propionibacteriales bacterium]|nr:sirohydrochlorin chelatase [Propionibacteriales bacterium]
MSAPALVALAHGSRDPRSAHCVREIVANTRRLRPDLRVEPAFLDHVRPDLDAVVDRLVAKGHVEIVVVPLLLTSAYHARVDVPEVVQRAAIRHPGVAVRASDVIGTDAALLSILDERLRESLRCARIRELDALVLAAAGSSDALANAQVARLSRVWGARHRLPTSVAFASTAPPSTGEAVRDWRRQGRRHVAVGSLFIAPGTLPDRAAELALEAGAVAVSTPLGAHDELGRMILARYSVGALQLVELPA